MNAIEKLSQNARITVRRPGPTDPDGKCVAYWMQRAQRGMDNPALDIAIALGNELGKPVVVFFAPVPFYPNANLRHYHFLRSAIPDIANEVNNRRAGFVLRAFPDHSLLKFSEDVRAAIVVGDENPLRETEHWRERAASRLKVPLWTVDSDVIVPSRLFHKEQYAARTIRPRIHALLPEFLKPSKNLKAQVPWTKPRGLGSLPLDDDFTAPWNLDGTVSAVPAWQGGSRQATRILREFVRKRLEGYPHDRNHPECDGTSRLSPYLHFGHISPLTVALAVKKASASKKARDAFLEQLIVRRELAINFVRFNPSYDSFESMERWADRSFSQHARDQRSVLYNEKQLQNAETHDPLWNAAQKQLVLTGWMHNYMRMYWAKKILEWSPSVSLAYQRAVGLNDRYELDGRDPNGYAGIAWAIVGKHDRPWFERPVFGQIRYMSYESTSRKFDSKKYIREIEQLE